MENSYPKSQKLKSRKTIEKMFSEGKSVSKYPLRLVYTENPGDQDLVKIGVSVSKKYFKRAVDRNLFKRHLREGYRLNKHLLFEHLQKPHAFMLLYQSKEIRSSREISALTVLLFEKFNATISGDDT